MKVVVVGSSGTIGNAVTKLLKEKGYEVIAASRSTNPGVDITDPSTIDNFYANLGPVDAIISVAGAAAAGSIGELNDEQIQLSVNSKLLGQINIVRKGLNTPEWGICNYGGYNCLFAIAKNVNVCDGKCGPRGVRQGSST